MTDDLVWAYVRNAYQLSQKWSNGH
jgi:hypothetical protein